MTASQKSNGLGPLAGANILMKNALVGEICICWWIQALGAAESDSAQKTGINSLDESSVALHGVEM